MIAYTFRRLLVAIPTLLVLIVFSFLLMEAAPGSPFSTERGIPPEVLANLEARYGLDQPLWKRMLIYIWNIVTQFDFGPSFVFKDRSVNDVIAQGFPVTLTYGFWSFVVAVLVGRPERRVVPAQRERTREHLGHYGVVHQERGDRGKLFRTALKQRKN